MRTDLDTLLCDRYPQIFRDRLSAESAGSMSRGFTHGNGWFQLVETLCDEIQRHVEQAGTPAVIARQVKEKLGTLRFYYQGGDEFIAGLVAMAQGLSAYLCEDCGAPGCCAGTPIATLCPDHARPVSPQHTDGADLGRPGPQCDFSFAMCRPGWRHLAKALLATLDINIRYDVVPPVFLEAVIETEALAFRWRGGDGKSGRVAGMLRLVEAYSLRCDPLSGRPVPGR